jgi:hypothetical protein
MRHIAIFLFLLCVCATAGIAQSVQVSRTNKTIAVTADESVSVDPDLAIVTVGYQNYGVTERQAYDENVSVADRLVKAIAGAGLDKRLIESGKFVVERVQPSNDWSSELRKQRQFTAYQSWKMTVPAAQAQGLVDLVMRTGANNLENVDWEVADRIALQAKASGAALAKARVIAEQMAKGLGAKLGELVYASNNSAVAETFDKSGAVEGKLGEATSEQPALTLFPQKVKEQATVNAVFAIE